MNSLLEPTAEVDTLNPCDTQPVDAAALPATLAHIQNLIPPLWRLQDYVAVNPFLGWVDQDLLATHQAMTQLRPCSLLMPISWYRQAWAQQRFTQDDLLAALERFAQLHPMCAQTVDVQALIATLNQPSATSHAASSQAYHTIAQLLDAHKHSQWEANIVDDISRLCASHYDQGQALWKSPWRDRSLFEDWKHTARISRRMEKQGLSGFRQRVASLPDQPVDAIAKALDQLGVPGEHRKNFLLCQLYSVAGWASYIRQRVSEHELDGQVDSDFVALLAIRLTYDAALRAAAGDKLSACPWPTDDDVLESAAVVDDSIARNILQLALEHAYQQQTLKRLLTPPAKAATAHQPHTQMVFCIDVRSEVIRRHLETVDAGIQTLGFAGFFGLPMKVIPQGQAEGIAQCPVLLQPSIPVHACSDQHAHHHHATQSAQWMSKRFQLSPNSSFHFVECLGGLRITQLLASTLRSLTPVRFKNASPHVLDTLTHTLSLDQQCDLAQSILKNTGLQNRLSPLVILCGHGSDVTNNPYQASLDCGACGGHSGEPNARLAAAILNNPAVRKQLAQREIVIPEDTHFLPAVHHTTTDQIELLDLDTLPASHTQQVAALQGVFTQAQKITALERSARLGQTPLADVIRRSQDWSEVRPEWGLAGNAAFIAGPREATAHLDLQGRTFLHSYDAAQDGDGKILELIMTAPMVVASWINLQYYASTVDNHAFGSGNKTIHNVVSQMGIISGNGGDLMTGLPLQSVHNGKDWEHQPLRLLVILHATRSAIDNVLARHTHVNDLVMNQWISLVSMENGQAYQKQSDGTWGMVA